MSKEEWCFEKKSSSSHSGMMEEVVKDIVSAYAPEKVYPEEWDWEG